MIELCDECEYSIIVADLIATLMTYDKHGKAFDVKIWFSNHNLPFTFDSDSHFDFLQEGVRIESDIGISYIFYDVIEFIYVVKK